MSESETRAVHSSPFVWFTPETSSEIAAAVVALGGEGHIELHTVGEKVYVHVVIEGSGQVFNDSRICPPWCPD